MNQRDGFSAVHFRHLFIHQDNRRRGLIFQSRQRGWCGTKFFRRFDAHVQAEKLGKQIQKTSMVIHHPDTYFLLHCIFLSPLPPYKQAGYLESRSCCCFAKQFSQCHAPPGTMSNHEPENRPPPSAPVHYLMNHVRIRPIPTNAIDYFLPYFIESAKNFLSR